MLIYALNEYPSGFYVDIVKQLIELLNPNKDLDEILDGYSWIKINKYDKEDKRNPNVYWKGSYFSLLKHHKKETEFLINKCRELANELKEKS